jgi:HEAT repeat protein
MAIAVLDALARDVDRWVWAGALAARGDPKLAEHAATLTTMGKSVPALARTAELIGKLRESPAQDSGTALLALDSAVQQLRATQLRTHAPAGELVPVADTALGHAPTRLSVRALYALVDALGSKKKPPSALESLLQGCNAAGDPRLWSPSVDALAHTYLRDIVFELVCSIGAPALPLLEEAFSKKGKAADAARLRAIGRIRGAPGESFYRECLATGSLEVRAASLECLHFLGPARLEPIVVTAFSEATQDNERSVFVDALARIGTSRTLELLFAFGATQPLICAEALAHVDADAFPTLVALARAQLGTPRSFPCSSDFRRALVQRDIDRGRADAVEVFGALLRNPNDLVRSGAADLALSHPDPRMTHLLAEVGCDDPLLRDKATKALFRLGEDVAYETLAPLAPSAPETGARGLLATVSGWLGGKPNAAPPAAIHPRLVSAIRLLSERSDRRWFELLLAMLPVDSATATSGLVALRDSRAVAPLVAIARAGEVERRHAVHALGELGAREGSVELCRLLDGNPARDESIGILTALTKIGDSAAAPAIRRFLERKGIDSFQTQCANAALARCGGA